MPSQTAVYNPVCPRGTKSHQYLSKFWCDFSFLIEERNALVYLLKSQRISKMISNILFLELRPLCQYKCLKLPIQVSQRLDYVAQAEPWVVKRCHRLGLSTSFIQIYIVRLLQCFHNNKNISYTTIALSLTLLLWNAVFPLKYKVPLKLAGVALL